MAIKRLYDEDVEGNRRYVVVDAPETHEGKKVYSSIYKIRDGVAHINHYVSKGGEKYGEVVGREYKRIVPRKSMKF